MSADFKTYIFPLLFFKRICDAWVEEYQEIVDQTGDEQLAWFPESHRFQIPENCHWNDVRTKANNVGAALQRAMREAEKANPDGLREGLQLYLAVLLRGRGMDSQTMTVHQMQPGLSAPASAAPMIRCSDSLPRGIWEVKDPTTSTRCGAFHAPARAHRHQVVLHAKARSAVR